MKLSGPERTSLLVVCAVVLPIVALRFFAPYDLQETDQGKQAQYALDAWRNGNWLAPGCLGVAATKPPLYTWLAGLVSMAFGRMDEWTIRVPTALAAIALVLVTWDIGRRLAGPVVGAAAAVALATSWHFVVLSGVVRTDGLLAFLIAAQVLVYVRSIDRSAMTGTGVIASAVLATAACLTKGPVGLLASAAVALHLVVAGKKHRAWREAVLPAAVGTGVLVAWFLVAGTKREDVFSTMGEGELTGKLLHAGFPDPSYYLLHTPPRIAPWTLLLLPAVWLAVRAFREPRPVPVDPLVSFAACWAAVFLVVFSFFPHQRPDLIYPAEPALALLVGELVRRRFPAWAPLAVATVSIATALVIASGAADRFLLPDTPRAVTLGAAAVLAAGAALAFVLRKKSAVLATFCGLAVAGLAGTVIDVLGEVPRNERVSTEEFGRTARQEAAKRNLPLVAIGFDRAAVLFDLAIASMPPADLEALEGFRRPLLVVVPRKMVRSVENMFGPAERIARYTATDYRHVSLVLLGLP